MAHGSTQGGGLVSIGSWNIEESIEGVNAVPFDLAPTV